MNAKILEKPVWEPRDKDATNTAKFITYVNQKHNLNIRGYDELHAWSTHDETLQDFWRDAYEWLELKPPDTPGVGRMLQNKDAVSTSLYPPPACFPCDRFNIAEFLLRSGKDNDVAIHFAREGVAGVQRVSWGEIRERTREIRDAMVNSGVADGDVVAAVISNSVDAITLSLATTSIGAVWSSSSPDLGSDAIVDRYGQIGPKMIFVDDGYIYAGKMTILEDRIAEWSHKVGAKSKQLLDVVVLPYCKLDIDLSRVHRGTSFQSFLQRGTGEKLSFNILPFSHPGFIVFSSGTTGSPKCIVHSAGGVALKVKTDMVLQHDIRKDDVVFQYTTTAWIMWIINFVNLSSGASMLLYDGSPYHPSPTTLLSLAQDIGVTVFGTSPRYLMDLKKNGIVPRTLFDLGKLRLLTTTGSVLSADQYHWFYDQAFPPQAHLVSMSGGTDIAGCFVGGTPLLPVYPGEIQVKALGMAVDIMNAAETEPSSVANLNVAGELVCTKPFPSQPLEFLGENGAEKYEASYFTRFGREIWCQGDYIQRNSTTGGYVMLGRSDGVLNPSGVRFGSAEIYAVTETFSGIEDSVCVGQKRESDANERVLLFVKLRPGSVLTSELVQKLRTAIGQRYSPRHVPRYILEVAEIPYTVNGKKCEINVKHIVSAKNVKVSGTVANPGALKLYERFQSLPSDAGGSPAGRSKL